MSTSQWGPKVQPSANANSSQSGGQWSAAPTKPSPMGGARPTNITMGRPSVVAGTRAPPPKPASATAPGARPVGGIPQPQKVVPMSRPRNMSESGRKMPETENHAQKPAETGTKIVAAPLQSKDKIAVKKFVESKGSFEPFAQKKCDMCGNFACFYCEFCEKYACMGCNNTLHGKNALQKFHSSSLLAGLCSFALVIRTLMISSLFRTVSLI